MGTLLSGYEVERRLEGNKLLGLKRVLDWVKIGKLLEGVVVPVEERGGGPRGYAPLNLFQAILLGQWHQLSDAELEEALKLRLDFMEFAGMAVGEEVPDHTTLCRFRNKLAASGKLPLLLEEINRQLEDKQLKVRNAKGAIIDATVIVSAARPQRVVEMAEDRKEPETATLHMHSVNESADDEARWLKKGSKSYYGYKGFARNESEDGYIEKVRLEPANVSECPRLGMMTEGMNERQRVYADKGSASRENRQLLKERQLRDGIMHKAARGHPLTPRQKQINRLIGKVRYKIEGAFGTLKRQFGLARARYFGRLKVEAQFLMAALGFNLLKAYNKSLHMA